MGNERNGKRPVDPELAKDPNYLAWKEREEELKASHMGEWVAFAGGQLVLTETDKETLFTKIEKEYPDQDVFIRQIVPVEPIYYLDDHDS